MQPSKPAVLSVRSMTVSDIDTVAEWFDSIDDMSLFDRAALVPASLEAVRENWKAELDFAAMPPKAVWYIAEDPSGKAAAIGGLRSINYVNGDAVLPAFVSRPMRGRGVGLRLAAMLLDAAFTRMRLVRVMTFYREDNVISAGLTEKAGFREEGRLRKAVLANGCRFDVVVAGLLQEEWLARRELLQEELDYDTVLRFTGQGNEQYDWPRGARADNLVCNLAARRERLEAADRAGTA